MLFTLICHWAFIPLKLAIFYSTKIANFFVLFTHIYPSCFYDEIAQALTVSLPSLQEINRIEWKKTIGMFCWPDLSEVTNGNDFNFLLNDLSCFYSFAIHLVHFLYFHLCSDLLTLIHPIPFSPFPLPLFLSFFLIIIFVTNIFFYSNSIRHEASERTLLRFWC